MAPRRAVSFLTNESAGEVLFRIHETPQEPAQGSFHKTGLNPFTRDSQGPLARHVNEPTFYARRVVAVHFMIVLSANPRRHRSDPPGIKTQAGARRVPRISKDAGSESSSNSNVALASHLRFGLHACYSDPTELQILHQG